MLEILSKIDRINQDLLVLLKKPLKEDDEEYVGSVEQLLNVREHLIQKVTGAQTTAEKELGQKIIDDNNKVNELFKAKTLELKVKINQFNQKKKNNVTYDNLYEQMSVDGIFIDKKK
ncbi:hypothetical protein DS745_07730 [Anaerobacillus alkaliphilus]|uniref:Flagellar protein FliT n=1 Tax=Anaerobacillus alkaliphilus TaxID=1548597 RepID=A0A4Q0VVW7_9BACI|nr:hypothetical protein [Anaerobacillus alkaliphilus]RXJ02270.1 hypothetical protein DS745_07730 [Anaerobacillus alkaliphilus]